MLVSIDQLYNREVYTHKGKYLGVVREVMLDLGKSEIHALLLVNTNPELVQDSMPVAIPYRWTKSVGEVIMLRYFPGKVKQKTPKLKARKVHVVKKERSKPRGLTREEWH